MLIMRNIMLRLTAVTLLTVGLILAPVLPDLSLAAEGAGAAAGAGSYDQSTGKAGGASVGVGVSGPSGKPAAAGKGALAPPKGAKPAGEKPEKSAEKKPPNPDETQEVPKGIAASAGDAGPAAASTGGGISMGWKIAGGVLGVGLLVGLAGSGGSSGGSSTSNH
jgi:hypothetical protein